MPVSAGRSAPGVRPQREAPSPPQRHQVFLGAEGLQGVGGQPLVLIVGAGPTGLVLGHWLTTLGVRVRIIDKTAEPGTTSRALAVQVRTLEFYRQVGIADALIAGGVKLRASLN